MTNIHPKHRIKNPGITLYAFHIRNDLATGSGVSDHAHVIWENLSALSEPLRVPELKLLTEKLVCYKHGVYTPEPDDGRRRSDLIQPERDLVFQPVLYDDLLINGFVYPLRLHDTYAADFTLFFPNQETDTDSLSLLNPGGCLLPSHIQADLGQTLLLFAEPADKDADNGNTDQALADECVKAFLKDTDMPCPPLTESGRLFGSPIFEYESEYPAKPLHILVWLNTHPQTAELAGKTNDYLINLLCCRAKIRFACNTSKVSNQHARQVYSKMESQTDEKLRLLSGMKRERPAHLEEFLIQMTLDAMNYTRCLRDMEDFRTMIKTNTQNHIKSLKDICEFSTPAFDSAQAAMFFDSAQAAIFKDDLKLWENFQNKDCPRFQKQIQTDLSYLVPGQKLFEQIISSIRGLVETDTLKQLKENEEREYARQTELQIFIAFIAFVLAGATISATVRPNIAEIVFNVTHLFDSLLFHFIAVGLPVGLLAVIVLLLVQKYRDN